jgi:hypothetical protein
MDLRQIGWGGIDWIDLAQDRDQWRAHVNTVMNLRLPKNAGKFLSSCATGGFSRTQLHGVSQSVSQSFATLTLLYMLYGLLYICT